MAWYAKIEEGLVTEVTFVVASKDNEWLYREQGGSWLRCEEDGTLRGTFPTVGYIYNKDEDKFYPQRPFSSWVFDQEEWSWQAPVSCPSDGNRYAWDEEALSWSALTV